MPVVCLHGLTRNSRDFEEVAPKLSALGRRVIVPDVRGRGRSDYDPRPMNYQPRTYARDVVELLDRLGISRAIFVGTSMGGLVTLALAMIRKRAIAGVVFNDAGPEISREGIARISAYAGKAVALEKWDDADAYVRRTAASAFPDFQDADWQAFVARTFREGPDGSPQLDYDPDIAKPIAKGRIRAASWLAWRVFKKITADRPTLLIRGALSDIVTAEIAVRMGQKSARMSMVEVPRVGHAPTLSEPVAWAALEEFLTEAP